MKNKSSSNLEIMKMASITSSLDSSPPKVFTLCIESWVFNGRSGKGSLDDENFTYLDQLNVIDTTSFQFHANYFRWV